MKSFLLITFLGTAFSIIGNFSTTSETSLQANPTDIKERAFKILEAKCNVCHLEERKKRIFTLENMDKNKKRINRQVFKWKKMPKGDDIKLTEIEYAHLKEWILEE